MSNLMEFSAYAECPHCTIPQYETFEFDSMSADQSGVDSPLRECRCFECDKVFWYKARLNFEVEIEETYKKKPKEKLK